MQLDPIRVNQERIMKADKNQKKVKRKFKVQRSKELSNNTQDFSDSLLNYKINNDNNNDSIELGNTNENEGIIEEDLLVESSLNERIEEVQKIEQLVNKKFVCNPRYNRMIDFKKD